MHIDEEQVQRLLHGELPPADEAGIRRHLAECGECEGLVARARHDESEVYALLRRVDHPAPKVAVETMRRRPTPWLRWAATIVLALGVAGAAYAIPGSPLKRWVHKVTHREPALPVVPDSALAGIAVPPGLDLAVLFTRPEAIGRIEVLLTDGAEVEVRAVTGAGVFSAGTDRLVVGPRDSAATFEVRIPRAAPRVQILLGDTRVMLKEGSRVVTEPAGRCRSEGMERYICS